MFGVAQYNWCNHLILFRKAQFVFNRRLIEPVAGQSNQQVPKSSSRAASMKFCAARQQSSAVCGSRDLARMNTRTGAPM